MSNLENILVITTYDSMLGIAKVAKTNLLSPVSWCEKQRKIFRIRLNFLVTIDIGSIATLPLEFWPKEESTKRPPTTFFGINLFGTGPAPEISLSSNIKVPAEFKFLFGDLKDGSNLVVFK